METVSVVVPVYNTAETLLKTALDCIVGQSYTDLQIIIVDDGSTNNAGTICDEYATRDARITVVHQANGGVSAARNAGLIRATGKYFTIIDSDDEIRRDALALGVAAIKRRDAELATWGWNEYGDVERRKKLVHRLAEHEETKSAAEVAASIAGYDTKDGGGYTWNKLWNVEKIKQNGGKLPLFDLELYSYEDKVWDIKLLQWCETVVLLPEIMNEYNYVPTSMTKCKEAQNDRFFNGLAAYRAIIDAASYNPEARQNALDFYNMLLLNSMMHSWKVKIKTGNAENYLRMKEEYYKKKELLHLKNIPGWKQKIKFVFFEMLFAIE